MTELDELDEINLNYESNATRKQRRAGRNRVLGSTEKAGKRQRWRRQLSAERAIDNRKRQQRVSK